MQNAILLEYIWFIISGISLSAILFIAKFVYDVSQSTKLAAQKLAQVDTKIDKIEQVLDGLHELRTQQAVMEQKVKDIRKEVELLFEKHRELSIVVYAK